MARQLFTAADIRRLVHEQMAGVLVLGAHDLITPEAVEVARQLGAQVVRENGEISGAPALPAGPVRLPPLKVARLRDTTFGAPSFARFVYVAFPANWSSGQ